MSQMSDYLENILTDHLFRTRTFSKPTTIGIALFTTAPTDGAGSGVEVSGNNYARVTFTPGDSQWTGTHGTTSGNSSGTGGASSNAAILTFNTPSANWGNIVAWAAFDAASGGNMLIWSNLTNAKTVNIGDIVTFQNGQIQVTMA